MMLDQIGIGQETTAVPMLMEIAAGEHESLRDQFVRIKAIEALGRLRAVEAVDLLRQPATRQFCDTSPLRAYSARLAAARSDRRSPDKHGQDKDH